MQTFGHLCAAFNDWKKKENITIGPNDTTTYFWRLCPEAITAWLPEFEEKVTDATQDEINAYRSMIREGGEIMGIPVAPNITNYRGAKLYKLDVVHNTFTMNDTVTVYEGNILSSDRKATSDGDLITIPLGIQPGSVHFTNTFDGTDQKISKTEGLIMGEGFKRNSRDINRLDDESIYAIVNYVTGAIQLVRSNSYNDKIIYDIRNGYKGTTTTNTGTGSNTGTNTGTSGQTGTGSSTENQWLISPLKVANITGEFNTFSNTSQLVFSFDLDSDDYFVR